MHSPYTQLYLHLVWAAWDRLPLIQARFRRSIYGCMQEQVSKRGCDVVAIGGIEDHVHLLLRFPTTVSVAEIVKHAKGASSNLMNRDVDPGGFFRWQGYYGAFTVAKSQVERVRAYIANQEEHHRAGTLSPELERVSAVP